MREVREGFAGEVTPELRPKVTILKVRFRSPGALGNPFRGLHEVKLFS